GVATLALHRGVSFSAQGDPARLRRVMRKLLHERDKSCASEPHVNALVDARVTRVAVVVARVTVVKAQVLSDLALAIAAVLPLYRDGRGALVGAREDVIHGRVARPDLEDRVGSAVRVGVAACEDEGGAKADTGRAQPIEKITARQSS